MSITPSVAVDTIEPAFMPTSNGNTLYVGGDGPGNYTRIQDAIDDASEGDTVFVYAYSSPYYEHVKVNKSISLIGEDRETTVIDGSGKGNVVKVTADCVNITGFTIQNGNNGILSVSNYNKYIENNIINNLYEGILLYNDEPYESGSNGNIIYGNLIKKNGDSGIEIFSQYYFEWTMPRKGCDNQIYRNIISYHEFGIHLEGKCRNNKIFENIISNSRDAGILLTMGCVNNKIIRNDIVNNSCGIYLCFIFFTVIKHNNFIDNYPNANFDCIFGGALTTRWIRNFWDDWIGFVPKRIKGTFHILIPHPIYEGQDIKYSWIDHDWLPALLPYKIEV